MHIGDSSASSGRSGFYRLLAEHLLPESERWFAHCPAATSPWEHGPRDLAEAVVVRFDRALRARDRLHQSLLADSSVDSSDETLFYLDALLMALNGAFDAIARVAHRVYGVEGSVFEASWRKELGKPKRARFALRVLRRIAPSLAKQERRTWMQLLSERAPALTALMNRTEPARDALDVVAELRNSIHAEALSTIGVQDIDERSIEYPVVVPPTARNVILNIIRRRGGDDAWGLRVLERDAFVLDVATFVETLFSHATDAVRTLMAAIDVERLGIKPAPQTSPSEWTLVVQRMRLLAGLSG